MTRLHIAALVVLGAIVWAVVLYVQGVSLSGAYVTPVTTVISILFVSWLAFDRALWRWQRLHPWFVSKPVLIGTWKGEIISAWIDPATGLPKSAIEVYVVVRQTYSHVNIRLFSAESASVSLAASIIEDVDGVFRIAWTYLSQPSILLQERSPTCHGGALVHVRGNPAYQLDGHYWTDRHTRGEIRLSQHSKQLAFDFQRAQMLFRT